MFSEATVCAQNKSNINERESENQPLDHRCKTKKMVDNTDTLNTMQC